MECFDKTGLNMNLKSCVHQYILHHTTVSEWKRLWDVNCHEEQDMMVWLNNSSLAWRSEIITEETSTDKASSNANERNYEWKKMNPATKHSPRYRTAWFEVSNSIFFIQSRTFSALDDFCRPRTQIFPSIILPRVRLRQLKLGNKRKSRT
jgi:hypothetical protein